MKSKKIRVSKKGKNWAGHTLNENNLYSGIIVFWKGNVYTTGNRWNSLVELYHNGKHISNVQTKVIRLVL